MRFYRPIPGWRFVLLDTRTYFDTYDIEDQQGDWYRVYCLLRWSWIKPYKEASPEAAQRLKQGLFP